MRIEERVQRVARRLAENGDAAGRKSEPLRREYAFDGIARAFVAPITRRRALVAAGGAVAAASLLRPARARADCFPGGPKVCPSPHNQKVCVPSNLQCCSNDLCAIACAHPWQRCDGDGACSDTPDMCLPSNVRNAGFARGATQFCKQVVKYPAGTCYHGTETVTIGWCCQPNEKCKTEFPLCECAVKCGDACCQVDEECVPTRGGDFCQRKCDPGFHREGENCVCDRGETCNNGLRCCHPPDPSRNDPGQVCINNNCVRKPAPDQKDRSWFDAFFNWGDTINQAAGVGGRHARDSAVAAAGTPVSAALLALAAVNTQGVAAGLAFTDIKSDNAYRRRVGTPRPLIRRLASGAGLDPRAAAALQALLQAEAYGFALLLASATALARARGALEHRNTTAARKQVLAAASFADKAARSLKRAPSLRVAAAAALSATGTAEIVVSAADVSTLQTQIRATGVPADLRGELRGLGIQGADLNRAKTALLVNSSGGPVLIAPLADPARTANLQTIATGLADFARRSRRHPITTSPGRPSRYRQHVV